MSNNTTALRVLLTTGRPVTGFLLLGVRGH